MCASSRKPSLPDEAPGPCPWYFGPNNPPIGGCTWEQGKDAHDLTGAAILVRAKKQVAVVPMYSYVMPLEGSQFLAWGQDRRTDANAPVMVELLDAAQLPPLALSGKALGKRLEKNWAPVLHDGEPLGAIAIPVTKCGKPFKLKFPPAMGSLGELFIVCKSAAARGGKGGGSLALLHVQPSRGEAVIHPQRWFNEADRDFDYEWVTRIGRDPNSGRICGDGIRIGNFVLDGSLEQLADA